jgi:hypothetical protein
MNEKKRRFVRYRIATIAVRHGLVEGVWLRLFHSYIATIFSKATGDDGDMIDSI